MRDRGTRGVVRRDLLIPNLPMVDSRDEMSNIVRVGGFRLLHPLTFKTFHVVACPFGLTRPCIVDRILRHYLHGWRCTGRQASSIDRQSPGRIEGAHAMDTSPRSPMTNSVADSPPPRGGGAMEDGAAPVPPVGGGVPYNPYPLAGSGPAGYAGYYMGPPHHGMGNGGVPHGGVGYGMPYGGAMGPVGAAGVAPPPPHHPYAIQHHPQASYGVRGVQGPPGAGGPPPNGMPSHYGRGYGIYEYYGAGNGAQQPMKPQQQALPHQPMQGERASPSSPSSKSTRGGFHGHGSSPRSHKDGLSSGSKSSPLESRSDESSPSRALGGKSAGDSDADRAKSAAEAELTPSLVKPLQSDFHFFVLAVKDRLRLEAAQEVESSMEDNSKVAPDPQQMQYLINTNLNARMMKEWEDMKLEHKESYLKKEEEDRKRFMEEDSVASRHCATLTARVKSPGDVGGGDGSKESSPGRSNRTGKVKPSKSNRGGDDDSESDGEDDPDLQLQATESQDGDEDDEEPVTKEKEPKRSPGEASQEDQSPSKKNRFDSEERGDEQR
jgi:hypothetical protein